MSEEEINKLVKEHYGFTIDDMDESIGIWMTRFSKEREKRLQLKSVLKEIREFCDYLLNNDKVSINGKLYYKTFDDDIVTKKLLEIIDKGIGEDK